MLGTRGCRLGILYPEIYEMQVEAILRAIEASRERTGERPARRDHDPLIDYERELELMEDLVARVAGEAGLERGRDFSVGTMIELPRACFLADHIARHADFFSFGTNDLTQTGLGFSRDDIEGKILERYIESKVFDRSPFETIDAPGRGTDAAHGRLAGTQDAPRASRSASAASTAATPTRSTSSTTRASTTCRARPSACPWRGWPRRRPRSAPSTRHRSSADVQDGLAAHAALHQRAQGGDGFAPARLEADLGIDATARDQRREPPEERRRAAMGGKLGEDAQRPHGRARGPVVPARRRRGRARGRGPRTSRGSRAAQRGRRPPRGSRRRRPRRSRRRPRPRARGSGRSRRRRARAGHGRAPRSRRPP